MCIRDRIIIALIPLALKGIRYHAVGAASLLRRNLAIYGLGGLVAPFIGIKLIDMAPVSYTHLDVYKRQPFYKLANQE